MAEFPKVSPGSDVTGLVLNSHWLNTVTEHVQARPIKLGRRQRGGGGRNSTRSLTAWGTVVAKAGKNGGVGRCVLLDEDMMPIDKDGEPLIIDENDPAYDQQRVDDNDVPFKCVQVHAGCIKGARVRLFANKAIEPEQDTWGGGETGAKVWGQNVDVVDYLADLDGFGLARALVVPDALEDVDGIVPPATPGSIKWQGRECGTSS